MNTVRASDLTVLNRSDRWRRRRFAQRLSLRFLIVQRFHTRGFQLVLMGRARTNRARRHFKYENISDISTGQVENCQHVASGDHGGNLERRLQWCHKGVHDKILADNKACCVG